MSPPLDPLDTWALDGARRIPEIGEAIARLDAASRSGSGGRYAHKDLIVAAREICSFARGGGLQVEQALVAVKDAWRATPGRGRRQGGPDEVLDLLITLCIREYYGPGE